MSNQEILALLFAALGAFFVLRGLWNVVSALDSRAVFLGVAVVFPG